MKFYCVFVFYCCVSTVYSNYVSSSVSFDPKSAFPVQQIASISNLKSLYKNSIPTKRYTIVHPNGVIEHVDDISAITARYPKYHMIKATDVVDHVEKLNSYQKSLASQNTPLSQSSKQFPAVNQFESTDVPSNQISNISNAVSINDSDIQPNTQEVINTTTNVENIPKEGNENTSIVQDPHNVVAGNPLPIYSAIPVSSDQNDVTAASDTNSQNSSNDATNPIVAVNQTRSSTPIASIETPAGGETQQTLPVILPEIQPLNMTQEAQVANIIEEPRQSPSGITTIEEAITSHNNESFSSSKLATVLAPNAIIDVGPSNENVPQIDNSTLNSTEAERNSTIPSDSNQTSTTTAPGAPFTWFKLSEDSVWEAIRSNMSNVYFFFLPPKPKRIKETKTTIFPNGTSIQEIIETDVDRDQDGQPKIIKNETIIFS